MASFFYHNMMTKNFCFGHTLIIHLAFLILLCCQKLIHLEKNRIFLNFSGGGYLVIHQNLVILLDFV